MGSPREFPKSALTTSAVVLGEGVFAKVVSGKLELDESNESVEVAVKKPKYKKARPADVDYEIQLMSTLNHQNILKLIGIIKPEPTEVGELPWLLLEYMEFGTLANFMRTNEEYQNSKFKAKVTRDLAAGMKYLSVDLGIVHGDLHANNVLIADFGERIKISDFGLSFKIQNELKTLNGPVGKFGRPPDDIVCTKGARWKAPEWIPGKIHRQTSTRPGDVWAFGILLFETWNDMKVAPYRGYSDAVVSYLVGRGFNPLEFCQCLDTPPRIKNLMERCFAVPLVKRPTFAKILEVVERVYPPSYFDGIKLSSVDPNWN